MKTDVMQNAREHFEFEVGSLLTKDVRGLGLLAHIRRRLRQYNLCSDYRHERVNVHEIVNECYLRGLQKIEKGEEIKNPLAWIRITAEYVILETFRKSQGKSSEFSKTSVIFNSAVVDVHIETTPGGENDPSEVVAEKEQSLMIMALLSDLKGDDGEILKLKWIDGYRWQEVAEAISLGGNHITADTARKRGRRALDRLKNEWAEQMK